MTAMIPTTPVRGGTVVTGTAVTTSDTIALSVLGSGGALVEFINGNASPDAITISDATVTATGALATAVSKTVTNATSQIFRIFRQQADPTTKQIMVTHTVTTSNAYKLYPIN